MWRLYSRNYVFFLSCYPRRKPISFCQAQLWSAHSLNLMKVVWMKILMANNKIHLSRLFFLFLSIYIHPLYGKLLVSGESKEYCVTCTLTIIRTIDIIWFKGSHEKINLISKTWYLLIHISNHAKLVANFYETVHLYMLNT